MTANNKNESSQYNLPAQIEQVHDKFYSCNTKHNISMKRNIFINHNYDKILLKVLTIYASKCTSLYIFQKGLSSYGSWIKLLNFVVAVALYEERIYIGLSCYPIHFSTFLNKIPLN